MCVSPFWLRKPFIPSRKYQSLCVKSHLIGCGNDGKPYINIPCPCGKCYECIQQNQREWQCRLELEKKYSKYPCYYVTLTYDPANLPVLYRLTDVFSGEVFVEDIYKVSDIANGIVDCNSLHTSIFPVINKRDVQLYMKRIRRYFDYYKKDHHLNMKYYVVGEYGGKRNRPHFHILLFNLPMFNFREVCVFLREIWHNGIVYIARPTPGRIKYVSKYMNKVDKRKHEVPYCRMMSNGIGSAYLTPENIKFHKDTKSLKLHIYGHTYTLPKYLFKKIFDEDEQKYFLNDFIENYCKSVYIGDSKFIDLNRDDRRRDNERILDIMFHHFIEVDNE